MKAETSDARPSEDSNTTTAVPTPAEETTDAASGSEQSEATSSAPKGKDKPADANKPAPAQQTGHHSNKNFIGHIHNLISSDLSSIEWACAHLVYVGKSFLNYAVEADSLMHSACTQGSKRL